MSNDAISVSSGISEETHLSSDAIAGRYAQLAAAREEILERARDMASLTVPSIFPNVDTTENHQLPTPFQSTGARAVNNLANKLLLTLFPVSSPFFKLEVAEGIVQQIQNQKNKNIKEEIEQKMAEMENIIQSDLEISAFRPKLFEALRQLIVVGNFLIYIPKEGEPEGFSLNKYVVKRSNSGQVLEIILKQTISREELPDKWKEQIDANLPLDSYVEGVASETTGHVKDSKYCLYTRIHLEDNKYLERKYINGIELEGTQGSYPKDANAWLALRWNGLSGEDYGRSYVEEYLGDLIALEGLSRSIQEHSAIASKTFGVIRPNSNMTPRDLASVPNGGFVVGEPEDLAYPEVGKRGDMQVAQEMHRNLTDSISRAFLITQVRDSERTTAAEIRLLANELETALGGAYSLQANTLQKPLLMREIYRLKKQDKLPTVHNEDISPKVIVGLEGLGRGTDLEKLLKASEALAGIGGVAQAIPGLDMDKVVQFVFNSVGLDSDEVLKSPEQLQQEQQAAQQQQLAASMTDAVTKGIGGAIPQVAKGMIDNPEGLQQLASGQAGGQLPTG